MLASKLAKISLNGLPSAHQKVTCLLYRNLSSQSREGFFRRAVRARVAPQPGAVEASIYTPLKIGQGVLAGASVIGLGSLVFYGLGLSSQSGILDHSAAWPSYVRERISTTYGYFGASLGLTAASALAVVRSPKLMSLATRSSTLAIFGSMALMFGSQMLVHSIPYEAGTFGPKQLAWALHSGIIGGVLAPLSLLGGPIVARAAMYAAGMVGGLSLIAATAPSEKFLNMGGPLAIGLGAVFAASLGSMFLPPTTRLGVGLYSISIYGGLILFSMLLLYDTQKIVKHAESSPHFDPINHSISIYMDAINIFVRMAIILSGGGAKKK